MPIDTSMYSQNPVDLFTGSFDKGLRLGDMFRQRREDSATREAFQKNMVPGADGNSTLNQQGYLSDLGKISPDKYMAAQSQMVAQAHAQQQNRAAQLDQKMKEVDLIGRAAGSAKDQPSYDLALANLSKSGIDISQMPKQFDPKLVDSYLNESMTAKDRLGAEQKQAELALRKSELGVKQQEVGIKRQEQNSKDVDKLAKDFRADMDPDRSRSGNFGQISAKYQSGERMKTLVDAFKDKNLPSAQVEELALGLANMVSGSNGGAARAQVEALVPKSAMGDAQKFKSWLMNEPYGANQQAFVEMMSHTVDREMDTATDQMNSIRAKRLSAHERFKRMAPDQYNNQLQSYGIDPKQIKNGQYQKKSASTDFHSMSDDEIDRAYKAAGGK